MAFDAALDVPESELIVDEPLAQFLIHHPEISSTAFAVAYAAKAAGSASFWAHPASIKMLGVAASEVADAIYAVNGFNETARQREQSELCCLGRDIFQNPFRPISINRGLLTPVLINLATTIYDERAFHRMPELAGALEVTGCTIADILDHCRGPGPHVRGCWALDLILGRE